MSFQGTRRQTKSQKCFFRVHSRMHSVSSAQFLRNLRMPCGQFLHVGFIDDRSVPGQLQPAVPTPVEMGLMHLSDPLSKI